MSNSQLEQSDQEEELKEKPIKSRKWLWILILVFFLIGIIGLLAYKTGFTFSQMSIDFENNAGLFPSVQSEKDPDRINILLLGLRGEKDPHGGLLTDAIMVLSIKRNTGQVALISIPRDLYIKMPGTEQKEKINFAYALGEGKKYGGGGIIYSKAIVSEVTGLYIDWAVSVNFKAFQEIVDTLEGINVYLDKPFEEKAQFTNEIQLSLPAGKNILNGETALYYVRSRFSTSDFDRMKRQQQVLIAIKEKALSLGVLTNPIKIFNFLSVLGRNVKTDMEMGDIQELLRLSPHLKTDQIIRRVFDTTPEGLLYSGQYNGSYILLPVAGDFNQIQEVCKNIFFSQPSPTTNIVPSSPLFNDNY